MVATGDNARPWLAAVIGVAGLVGSFFVIRMAARRVGVGKRADG
jgi:hypothetical protein